MRTAEEIVSEIRDNDCLKTGGSMIRCIKDALDEAVAHGMTLAAATVIRQPAHKHCGEIRDAILTARDNKVWMIKK